MHALENPRQLPLVRLALWVAAPALVLVALALSLSDRVPGLLEDLARTVRIDDYVRDGAFGYSPWTIGHFFLWAAVVWFVVVSLGRREWAVPGAVAVFSLSLLVEGLQVVFTASRAFQGSDVAANVVGTVTGGLVAAATLAVVDRRRQRVAPAVS